LSGRYTGAEALVAGLERWNIGQVFGLPGVQLDPLFDALYGARERIRVIHARHEQGAAYMAFGSAMATGRPAVFTVVPGPGVLNASAALATAYACNAPVLCITSTISWPLLDRHYGALHEIPDQTGMLARLTKWSARAEHATQIPELIDAAFRQLLSGRPRPVALEIPPEVLAQRVVLPARTAAVHPERPLVDPEQIDAAARILARAKSPFIVIGGGAQHAAAPVRELAELLQAPVLSRQMGRGILPDEHPLALHAAMGNRLWTETDVVVAIGTRLQQLREWGADANLQVIRIDIDPMEHARIDAPAVGIVADAADATEALVSALRIAGVRRAQTSIDIRGAEETFKADLRRDIPLQVAYLEALRAELPRDAVIVDEITQVGHAAKLALPLYEPRSLITSGYQGTLGFGYATALGAQAALPDRRVISINGDGGFLYTQPEMATAVLHDIPLIAIVFNDNCFGNVQSIQRRWYGGRVIATDLHNPDFMTLAESFGMRGLRAGSPEELREALRAALARQAPTLIEVPVAQDSMGWVWSFIVPERVRGAGSEVKRHG
jgi:acetolactate synthase I/II/III large subunit